MKRIRGGGEEGERGRKEEKNIQHRTSNIERRTSNVERRTPNVEHRTSNIEHRTSNTEHRTPSIEHRASNIEHGPSAGRCASRPLSPLRPLDGNRTSNTEPGAGRCASRPLSPLRPLRPLDGSRARRTSTRTKDQGYYRSIFACFSQNPRPACPSCARSISSWWWALKSLHVGSSQKGWPQS